MTEVAFSIEIKCYDGPRKTRAWARSPDSPLACHVKDHDDDDLFGTSSEDYSWVITHLKTGRQVSPSETSTREEALALLDTFLPVTDWQSVDENNAESLCVLRERIVDAYQKFWNGVDALTSPKETEAKP